MKIMKLCGIVILSMGLSGCMAMHGLLGLACGGMMGGHGDHKDSSKPHQDHQPAPEVKTTSCPVCGTSLTVSERTPRMTHADTLYYFDTEEHLKKFIGEPDPYLKKKEDNPGGGEKHN